MGGWARVSGSSASLRFLALLLAAMAAASLALTAGRSPDRAEAITPPTTVPRSAGATTDDIVIVGAGDIGDCDTGGPAKTAALIGALPAAPVFTAGDNAYPDGTAANYADCYDPSWGAFKDRTYPAVGNHDWANRSTGYFAYFGATQVGAPDGYYSYDLGPYWHAVVLNTEISFSVDSPQELWLRADLAANPTRNVIAFWHDPRFNSGSVHGTEVAAEAIWRDLYEYGADVVVNGHEHSYERFAPQTPDGVADPEFGIREFIAGTGGGPLYDLGSVDPNSEVFQADTWGVLELTLGATNYAWTFLPVAGSTFTDSGTQATHSPPGIAVTVPGPPTAVVAAPGNTSAAVSWATPASDGGSTITGYTVTSTPDSKTCTTSGAHSCTVSSLVNGTPYTFTVTATNAGGTGPASDPSNSVTPRTVPGPPTGTVTRLAGSDRFATAAAVSAATFAPGVDVAYIAYAYNFPDAMVGGAAAGTTGGPVLLAATGMPLNASTTTELLRLKPKRIVVLGSSGVISETVRAALAGFTTGP